MSAIAFLFGLGITVALIISIFRISGNVRRIREHLDFIAPGMRAAWKHQGIDFGVDPDRSGNSRKRMRSHGEESR